MYRQAVCMHAETDTSICVHMHTLLKACLHAYIPLYVYAQSQIGVHMLPHGDRECGACCLHACQLALIFSSMECFLPMEPRHSVHLPRHQNRWDAGLSCKKITSTAIGTIKLLARPRQPETTSAVQSRPSLTLCFHKCANMGMHATWDVSVKGQSEYMLLFVYL